MDISELLSSISDEDMQKLKETAQGLLASQSGQTGTSVQEKTQSTGGFPMFDPKLLGSIGKVAGMMNSPDPRCEFLMALKPLLGKERQGRVDEAVKMLRMMTMLPRVMELGGNGK